MGRHSETRRRDLSTAEIVTTAIEISGETGELGLTMRRVADACGVTPMALYHHVADKEELLTLIADHVMGVALAEVESRASWREDLLEFGCRFRQGFLDHRVAAEVLLRRPILSENLARCTEYMFERFKEGGLDTAAIAQATDALVLITMGSIANDLTRPPAIRDQLLEKLPVAEAPLLAEGIHHYSHRDGEARYRLAVTWMLDGLEADPAARGSGRVASVEVVDEPQAEGDQFER